MFCHLHVHSEYSILQSAVKIDELIEKTVKYGMKSIALTDHFVMCGAIKFHKKAHLAGIKPIIGMELLVFDDGPFPTSIILLAKNIDGYKNLCRISSLINLKQKYERNYINFDDVKEFSKGLICIVGFEKNEFLDLLLKNNIKNADEKLKKWINIFKDDIFMEIIRVNHTCGKENYREYESSRYREKILMEAARRNGIGIVASNNVSYLSAKDFHSYKMLLRIYAMSSKETKSLSDTSLTREYYLKSPKEMNALFSDISEAIRNTEVISDRCSLIDLNRIKTASESSRKIGESRSFYDKKLSKICHDKATELYKGKNDLSIKKRLSYELKVIEKTGFAKYFLTVADIAEYAAKNKIPICGKGSSVGSIVTYLLGISNIDPVSNNLCFERFLHEERKTLPDIDIDISSAGRNKIIDFLLSKHGRLNVLRMPIFTTIGIRASLREAGRILNISKQEIQSLVDEYPLNYRNEKLKDKISKEKPRSIENFFERTCYSILGYIRYISMHPCAFLIADESKSWTIPLMLSETGEVMSQYDTNDIEDMGFLKIDLINSVTLDHISEVSEILSRTRNINIDFLKIPKNDKKVYKMLSEGSSLCVFQLESMGIRSLMKKLKPESVEDIMLLISLYRPGPQKSGMVDTFIRRKFNIEDVDYMHKDLEEILKETCGVILYQEQVMKIAEKISGYSHSEADRLRKAITKLSMIDMEKEKKRFILGALKKGYGYDFATNIFDLIFKFASYGFVKAHASVYAEIGYRTAYIKSYFPAELISVILTRNSGYYRKDSYIEEAKRLGISIKLPDINMSSDKFLTENDGKALRISLSSIKDIGQEGVSRILDDRNSHGAYKNFYDFYERIISKHKISLKAAENLIKIGAFDFTGFKRKYLIIILEYLSSIKRKKKNIVKSIIDSNVDYTDELFPETADLVSDYNLNEKIEIEMELLGFCATISSRDYSMKNQEFNIKGHKQWKIILDR